MTTISKMTENLAAMGNKFGIDGIDLTEVGAMQLVHKTEGKLSGTYAYMIATGILPSDYLSFKNKESTATEVQYKARAAAAKLICYNKTERAELATKLPKDATPYDKNARKDLQSRHTELLKTVRRGLITAHKLACPEEYVSGGANEPKTAIEDLAALMEKATKLLQGDKPFPDTFAHDDAIAVLKGFVKTFC